MLTFPTARRTLIAQINDEMKAIECILVVSRLSFVAVGGVGTAGLQITLECHAAHDQGGCAKKSGVAVQSHRVCILWYWDVNVLSCR